MPAGSTLYYAAGRRIPQNFFGPSDVCILGPDGDIAATCCGTKNRGVFRVGGAIIRQ
jgi:hypothetical protein